MDEVECRLKVNINYSIPLCLRHSEHKAILCYAGVVYQNIQSAKLLYNCIYNIVALLKISSVGGYCKHPYAKSLNLALCLLTILIYYKVCKGNICALCGKFKSNGLANASCSSGYKSHFSF